MHNPYAAPGLDAARPNNGDNPYTAPSAGITDLDENAPYEPSMFMLNGRIGRWRFLGYSWGYLLLMGGLMMGAQAIGLLPPKANDPLRIVFGLLSYIPLFITSRRRLNDLDHSGWWMLMYIVPFLNLILGLYLTFGSGTEGANRFGPPPDKNHPGIYILFLIPFIGIVAAIAIPAYQKYQHAHVYQSQ